MKSFITLVRRLVREEDGEMSMEYALIASLVVVTAATLVGTSFTQPLPR